MPCNMLADFQPSRMMQDATYLATADYTFILVISKTALIAYSDKGGWADVRIADRAFTVALVAKTADSYARLLTTHNQIAMMCVSRLYPDERDNGT